MFIHAIIQSGIRVAEAEHKIMPTPRASVNIHIKYKNGGKCDHGDLDQGVVVGARRAGLIIQGFGLS